MAKVTVLVAAYNAAAFLAKALDSLLAQTHSELQVVCIDDGSTDETLSLMQHYSQVDGRIEVVELECNHGQAFARNEGLKRAQGDYVCFLDADDWLSPDALQLAVDEFEHHPDADCVLFDVEYVYPDHSDIYSMPSFQQLTGTEAFRLSLDWQIHGVYMVRTNLHQRFPYDDTCKTYSDDNTTRLHYLASRSVRRCAGVYHYLQHEQSATHQVSVRRFDFLRANESMKRQLEAVGAGHDVMCQWETTRLLVLVDCYMFYHVHGRQLTKQDAAYGLGEMHRVWGNIDRTLLNGSHRKFGYCLMPSWWMFRVQEWLYFTLRGLFGKNK